MNTKDIEERLLELQDTKYRDFHHGIVPTVDSARLIGVRMPQLRTLAKEIVTSGDTEALLPTLPHRWYEENILHAIIVSGIKDYCECLRQVERMLPYIDNWAVCDCLRPRCFARHTDDLLPHIRRWLASEHEYTVRFGIGMLECFYLDDKTFSPSQLEMVAAVRREEYYIRMMQAWYFATALAKQWDATLPIISELPEWVRRKTVQKARESYRVTPEHKDWLKVKG